MRSYQRHVRNPRTPEQVAHREMFKQEVQLAARMRWAIVTSMTDTARASGVTSYNLFVRENQQAFGFADGTLQVDYAALRLSMGDVQPVTPEEVTLTDDNVLSVSFDRGSGRGFDLVYLYVYVPDLGSGYLASPVYRRNKHIMLSLPDNYAGHELHAYLMVQSEDGRWSDSVYVDCSNETTADNLELPDTQSNTIPEAKRHVDAKTRQRVNVSPFEDTN